MYTDVAADTSEIAEICLMVICWPTRNIFKCKRKTKVIESIEVVLHTTLIELFHIENQWVIVMMYIFQYVH